jgi:hypothetical protein
MGTSTGDAPLLKYTHELSALYCEFLTSLDLHRRAAVSLSSQRNAGTKQPMIKVLDDCSAEVHSKLLCIKIAHKACKSAPQLLAKHSTLRAKLQLCSATCALAPLLTVLSITTVTAATAN